MPVHSKTNPDTELFATVIFNWGKTTGQEKNTDY